MANIEIFGTLVRNDDNTNRDKIVQGIQVEGGYFVCSAIPTSGTWQAGQLCYCTADSKFYQYNGSSWQEKEFGGGKKYKHNIVLSGAVTTGPGYCAYCTFSFINNGPSAISTISELDTALAVNFSTKICPACGLFSYNGSSMTTGLVTGVIHNDNGIGIYSIPLASTTSDGVMTINAISTASSGINLTLYSPFVDGATTVTDTVEEC